MKRRYIVLTMVLCGAAQSHSFSQTVKPRPENGKLKFATSEKRMEVKVNVTDGNANIIPTERFPRTFEFGTDSESTLQVLIPEKVNRSDNNQIEFIKDVSYTMTNKNGGMRAEVMIESLFFDSGTNQFSVESIFGTVANHVGFDQDVFLPNLFADTDGDGVLSDRDALYQLVDLDTYLNTPPAFSLGDSFAITEGRVNGLPGMQFSTTPFTFDPVNGFAGTPFTGEGRTDVRASAAAIPEPGAFLLFGAGALGLLTGAGGKRRTLNP